MREIKDFDIRKNEILDAAEALFVTKGYNKTTIIDILSKVGIAKGTFYYYFKSKEEVMDEIIFRVVDRDVEKAETIVKDNNMNPIQKIQTILMSQKPELGDKKDKLIEQFHAPGNAEMHQRSLVYSVKKLSPILAEVVRQGIEEGVFETEYPLEAVEFLMAAGEFVFDIGLCSWNQEELEKKAKAFINIVERTLGAKKGSFEGIIGVFN